VTTALLIIAIIIGAPIVLVGIAFFALFILAAGVNRIERKAATALEKDICSQYRE
jgi:hypothetical protein